MAVMGYDPEKKVYTYNEYNSMGQINHSEGTVSGDVVELDQRREHGRSDFQGPLHHESSVSDFVHVYLRNVEGWRQLDDGHGGQGHQEVGAKTCKAQPHYRRGKLSKNVRSRRPNSAGCSMAA